MRLTVLLLLCVALFLVLTSDSGECWRRRRRCGWPCRRMRRMRERAARLRRLAIQRARALRRRILLARQRARARAARALALARARARARARAIARALARARARARAIARARAKAHARARARARARAVARALARARAKARALARARARALARAVARAKARARARARALARAKAKMRARARALARAAARAKAKATARARAWARRRARALKRAKAAARRRARALARAIATARRRARALARAKARRLARTAARAAAKIRAWFRRQTKRRGIIKRSIYSRVKRLRTHFVKCIKRLFRKCPRAYKKRGNRCYHVYCPKPYIRRGARCVRYYRIYKNRRWCPRGFKRRGSRCIKRMSILCAADYRAFRGRCHLVRCPRGFSKVGQSCKRSCKSGFRLRRGFCVFHRYRCPKNFYYHRRRCVRFRRGSTRCPRGYRKRGRRCVRTIRSCPLNFRRRGRRCVLRCPSGRVPRRIRRGVIRCVVVTSRCPLGYSLRRVRRGRRYRFRCVINAGRCTRGFRRIRRYKRGYSCVRIVCPRNYRKLGSRCIYQPSKSGSRRCPAGYEKVRGLCRKLRCPMGHVRRRSRCVRTKCPRFYRRVGRFCARIRFVGRCPRGWLRSGRLCRRRLCPSGFKKVGLFCTRRSCPSGYIRRGTVCYKDRCSRGYQKMGSVCIQRCPSGTRATRYFCIRRRCRRNFRRVGHSCVRARCPSGYVSRTYRTRVYLKHRVAGYKKSCSCIGGKPTNKPRINAIDVAFVVDVTGSMGKVINAIKSNIISVIKANARSRVVDKFVLVPFADPTTGPITVSRARSGTAQSRLIRAVRRMRARGGGDCPEMSHSGMYEALRRIKRNSIVYVFTDASPSKRDKRRERDVLRLASRKKVQLNFLLSGPMCGKRSSYKNLSKRSGGAWIRMSRSITHRVMRFLSKAIPKGATALRQLNRRGLDAFIRSKKNCTCYRIPRLKARYTYVNSVRCFVRPRPTTHRCSRILKQQRRLRRAAKLYRRRMRVGRRASRRRSAKRFRLVRRQLRVIARRLRRCFRGVKESKRCGRRVCRRNQKCVTHKSSRRIRSLTTRISRLTRAHSKRTAAERRRHATSLRKTRTPRRYLGVKLKHACEGSSLSISCPARYVIQVLRGFYGRTSNRYCARGPRKTYKCNSGRANRVIASRCNNRRSCRVSSSNRVFGDPCRGTYKYMTVRYRCKLAASVASSYAKRRARLAAVHKRRLNALRVGHRRRIARLNRLLSRARRGTKRCVRIRRGPCSTKRCPRGRRCIVSRVFTKAGRKLFAGRRRMVNKYRKMIRALRIKYRKARRASKLAFKRVSVASRLAIRRAKKAKKVATVKRLKKAFRLRRRSFVRKLRNQRKNYLKALRSLRKRHRSGLSRHNRKIRKGKTIRRVARCVVDQCLRKKCKPGFSCRHVRRFTRQFSAFLRQRRSLTRSYFLSHKKILSAYQQRNRKAVRNFRKYAATYRSNFKRAKSSLAKRRLRAAYRNRLRSFRRGRRAAFKQYRRAARLARRSYLKRLKSLRRKQGKATFRNRVRTVGRCIRKIRRSCRNVRCSAGKRCVVRAIPTWWYRLYRISVKRAYRRFHARLRRTAQRLRYRHRVNHRYGRRFRRKYRGRKGSRRPKSFSFWLRHTKRSIRRSRRFSTRRVRRSRRNLRRFAKSMRKVRSRLWGRFRKAAKRYRRRFRKLFRRISKRRKASRRSRVPKSVVRRFRRNEKKYSRRVFSLKNWFGRKLRLFKALYDQRKKANKAKRKSIENKMRVLYRRISYVYRRRLRRAVVSYYKRRGALASSLQRRLKFLRRRLSRRKGKRMIRRAMCVASNPCKRKRCRRGYKCKVQKIKSKNGRKVRVGRCVRRYNPCKKLRCGKNSRCIVRRIPTREYRLYRFYKRVSRRRFRLRARRIRRRLSIRRRRLSARAMRRIRRLRRSAARRLRGRRLARRLRTLKRSLKRTLRRYRSRSTRSYRRLRNKLRLRLRRAIRRKYRRLIRNNRRYTTRAVCRIKRPNPCSKKRCPKGSRCVVRRRIARLYRRFRRITKRHYRRYTIAKRKLSKLSRKRRVTATRRLKRSLKRKLRKIRKAFKRRGAFKRNGRLVARCYRPGKRCPRGYRSRGRTCVRYYRVCPRTFTLIKSKRGVRCIKFNKICKPGRFLFNSRCWKKCPAGTRRSSSRSCKLVKSCPAFVLNTRCVKSCPRRFVAVGRRCRRCPKNSFRRGNNCYRRRIYCSSGFSYRRACRRRCPKHTYTRGRRCIRARCPKDSMTRLSIRRGKIVCIRKRVCKRGLVYYSGSCKSKCPTGTRRRRWYCQKICKKGFIRVGFRRQRCIRGYCYNKFRIGRSCVRKCPLGYIGVRRTCRKVSISCPTGYLRLGRILCLRKCPAGYTKRGRQCAYAACRKGTFRYRGTCMKGCPAGTKRRGSYCFKRSKCRFGRFSYGKKCLERCPPGHYRSYARRSCVRIKRCKKGLLRFRRLCLKACPLGFRRKKRSCVRKYACRNGKMYRGVCIVTRCPSGTRNIRGSCERTPRLCPSGRLLLIRSNGARSCVRVCPRTYTAVRKHGSCKPTRCPRGTYRLGITCRKTCPKGFRARRGRCRLARKRCKSGLFRLHTRCVKRCPKGFRARGGHCHRVPLRCSKGTFRFKRKCVKKCPKNYTGRVYKPARRAAIRYCRLIRSCKKGQVLVYRRVWSRLVRRSRYRSRCASSRKPCRTGYVLTRRVVRFNRGRRRVRRVLRLCKKARDSCAKGLFLFRAKCRKQCPRGMRTLLVRRARKVVRTCKPKCGRKFALRSKCVRRCPRGYTGRIFRFVKFCKKDCSRGKFSFRGSCVSRCPVGYRKRAYRVYSRRSRKLVSITSCAEKTKCPPGYGIVYRLKRRAKGRSIRATEVCRRIRDKTCRYPTALAFGRCYRRCPSGYYRRSRTIRGRRLGFCLPTTSTILCRRIRCSRTKICVIRRQTRVFRAGKRAVRRTVRKPVCVPRYCKAGTYRYKHRCVRKCPRGYIRRSSKRFRMHKGRRLAYKLRLCTRKLCKYPKARYNGRCVKKCPSTYEKKVYNFRFRYRKTKFMRRYAVCRRNLCSKVACSRNQRCIVKSLPGRKVRQVAACVSKNPCYQMRCRRGFTCRIKRVSGRRRASCVPSIPLCKAGFVGFRSKCQRRCPKNHRVLSKKIGGRLYRVCARDACPRGRFFSAGRCVQRCATGFAGRSIRYSKSYTFKYCAPKACKRRRYRLGVRCVRRCPSGYRRRYFRSRRGVRRFCAPYACRKGTLKLGKRCVKNCPRNYKKRTVKRGSKSFQACVPKKCPAKSLFIMGRCRKALKGCYDKTYKCKILARRKRCSRKLVKFLCPVSCGTCNPKKRKLCTCTSMGDPHYRTFDGQWIHFMGKCKYLLAKSKLRTSSKCNFSVTAKNEVRGKKRRVSWTRFVEIKIHGVKIRLHQKRRVFLNGKRVRSIPISLYKSGKKLRIYRSGKNVVVESKYCGLYLEFNGRSVAELHLPKSRFAGKVKGICGNCNGNPKDDLKTRRGKDVSKLGSKGFVQIGQSYLVADRSTKSSKCKVSSPSSKCPKSMKRKVRSNRFCGLISNKKGPFRACLKSGKVNYAKIYKSCEFDVCQYRQGKNRRRAVCESLETLYNECLAKGFKVSWRRRRFCPLKCGANSAFRRNASGCPRTCADIGRRRKCRLPSREGCVCNEGFVLNGKKCVPERNCGKTVPLDLAFIVDGTDDISSDEFEALKNLIIKLLTKYRLSASSVRPAIAVFGRTSPTVSLFNERPDKSDFMAFVRKIKKPGGSADNLDAALRVAGRVMMKPMGGARPEVPKHIVLLKKSRVPASSESVVKSELDSLKKANIHVVVITLPQAKPTKVDTAVGGLSIIPARMPPYLVIPKITKELEKTAGCTSGFKRQGKRCRDVNECAAKVPPCHSDSTCVNLPGSYICLCRAGFRHDRSRGCVSLKEEKCPSKPKCENGYQFDRAKGKCVDINECKENPCLGESATCINIPGSFKCKCRTGFKYNKYFGCVDIDECKGKNPCAGTGKCVNTLGSFNCTCDEGYTYKTGVGCKDIDECATGSHNCKGGSKCINTAGSYNCSCDSGYRFETNKCVDIDECAEDSKLCDASATCVNKKPGYECKCKLGNNWVHKAGRGCVPDERKGMSQRMVDFIFTIDGSDKLKASEKDIKNFLTRLLNEFTAKELKGLSVRASVVLMGKKGGAELKFSQADLSRIEDRIKALSFPGGKTSLLEGMKKADQEHAKARNGSTPIVFLITGSNIKVGDVNLPAIKRLSDNFKSTGKFFTVQITPAGEPADWSPLYTTEEISHFVTVIRSSDISTIYKLMYKRIYPLINCPEGFVKTRGLCQLQTATIKYCKTDAKQLRPVGSTWQEECSQFKCTDSGVQVLSRRCLGYDGQCYSTEEYFPCTQVTGSLSWKCRCRLFTRTNKKGKKVEALHYQSIATSKEKVVTENGRACVFPFKYQNKWLYNCDEYNGRYWCSYHRMHETGSWGYCKIKESKNRCTDPFNPSKMYIEGERWNHGCNVMECTKTGLRRIPKCQAADKTCKSLHQDGYSCHHNGKLHNNCICVQNSAGWGKNEVVSGDRAKEVSSSGGSVISVCVDRSTGSRYEQGQEWTNSCFRYKCTAKGGELLQAGCEQEGGKCRKIGDKGFNCVINGKSATGCECAKDGAGNPTLTALVSGRKLVQVLKVSEVSTSLKTVAKSTSSAIKK